MTTVISLPSLLTNGPEEVGLAAGADLLTDPALALMLGDTNESLTAYKYADSQLNATQRAGAGGKYAAAYRLGAFAIAQFGLHAGDSECNVVQFSPTTHAEMAKHDGDSTVTPVKPSTLDRVKADLAKVSMDHVFLIVLSTKVTWWQCNHHVGQGAYAGFAAKVARFVFGQEDSHEGFKELHWRLGHMVSTKMALHKMGVKGIDMTGLTDAGGWPNPTRDITIRLKANPAGTAKLYDTVMALTIASRTPYAMLFPVIGDLKAIFAGVDAVEASPVQFHVGARFLTGSDAKQCVLPLDDTMEAAAAFIHAFSPNGTLAKNKALPGIGQISGHAVYTNVVKIKTKIMAGKDEKLDVSAFGPVLGANMLKDVGNIGGVPPWTPPVAALPAAGTAATATGSGTAQAASAPATAAATATVGTGTAAGSTKPTSAPASSSSVASGSGSGPGAGPGTSGP